MTNRREFLGSLGAGTAALACGSSASAATTPWLKTQEYKLLVPELFQPLPTPPSHSQVLVIGSGFGGAVSSLRLAQAGQQVTILERGSLWPNSYYRDIFSNDTLPDGRAFWHRTQARMIPGNTAYFDDFGGVMDVVSYPNMTAWCGAAVGGGSIVFTGVMIQPQRKYFDAIFGGTVNFDEMSAVYYPRVKQMLRLSTMPADVYNSAPFGHSRAWDAQAIKAGYTTSPIDSIFNWDVIRAELQGRSRPSATIALSNHGNSNGAKYDLNQNYLAQAQATGRAKIYPGQVVKDIGWDGSRYTVDVITQTPDGVVLKRSVLTCDKLILAAGSIGSTNLLVKAQAKGYLPRLNSEVGKGWGTNGDSVITRSFSPSAGLTQGSPSASLLMDTSLGIPITLENWDAPSVPINLGIVGSLGMAFDQTNRGRFVYDASTDSAQLQWAANGNDEAVAAATAVNNKICAANGAVPGFPPLVPAVQGSNWTAHPLGGSVLNKATDNLGRVVGYPGLYVMDGALIPGTTGAVNPSLTISALAERNIEKVIAAGG